MNHGVTRKAGNSNAVSGGHYGLSSHEPKRAYLRLLDHSRIKVGFEKKVLQETAHYGTFFGSQTAH